MTETWHDRFRNHVLAKDYASALAMLRAPAPQTPPSSDDAEGVLRDPSEQQET